MVMSEPTSQPGFKVPLPLSHISGPSDDLPQVAAVDSELSTSSIFMPRVFLDLHLGHDRGPHKIKALYDTGAVTSLMSSADFRNCQAAGGVVGEIEPDRAFRLNPFPPNFFFEAKCN